MSESAWASVLSASAECTRCGHTAVCHPREGSLRHRGWTGCNGAEDCDCPAMVVPDSKPVAKVNDGSSLRDDILKAMDRIRSDTSWLVHVHLISPEEARAGRGYCIECGALVERKP